MSIILCHTNVKIETRAMYENLKFVIIEVISMMKADQPYQLYLRLLELMVKPYEMFRGVSIICFGYIMHPNPCKRRYIWREPANHNSAVASHIR